MTHRVNWVTLASESDGNNEIRISVKGFGMKLNEVLTVYAQGNPSETSDRLVELGVYDKRPIELNGIVYDFEKYVIHPTINYASGGEPCDWFEATYKKREADQLNQRKFDRDILLRMAKIGYALHVGGLSYGEASELFNAEAEFWYSGSDANWEDVNVASSDLDFRAAINVNINIDVPRNPDGSKRTRGEFAVRNLLKRAWDLAEIAEMTVEDYQKFFEDSTNDAGGGDD